MKLPAELRDISNEFDYDKSRDNSEARLGRPRTGNGVRTSVEVYALTTNHRFTVVLAHDRSRSASGVCLGDVIHRVAPRQ